MYRVLLVDDEANIVDALGSFLQQARHEQIEVLKSYSGAEAMSVLARARVDAVITDIEMMGTSGLDVHERIARDWPHCRTIFLTAHDRFDYAYRATQSRRTRFLLKSEGFKRVLETLEEVLAEIEGELFNAEMMEALRTDAKDMGVHQQLFLRSVLEGMDRAALAEGFHRFSIVLSPDKRCYPVLLRLRGAKLEPSTMIECLAYLERFLVRHFGQGFDMAFVPHPRDSLLVLFQPSAAHIDPAQYLGSTLELLQDSMAEIAGADVDIALPDAFTDWEDLGGKAALMRRMLSNPPENAGFLCRLSAQELALAQCLLLGDQLYEHMLAHREEEAMAALGQWAQLSAGLEGGRQALRARFVSVLLRYLVETGLGEWDAHLSAAAVSAKLGREGWEQALGGILSEALRAGAQRRSWQRSCAAASAIRRADAFMAEQYARDLSLPDIAEHVGLSPSYLSRMYKQRVGMGIVDRLTQIRIERAKRLLADPQLRIYEIAEMTGFRSARYFTSIFRINLRMSPQEYRDQL